MHLKSSDRIEIRTPIKTVTVKGNIYKGFGINEAYNHNGEGRWNLTLLSGEYKGWAIVSYNKKNDCKKLADELLSAFNRADLTIEDLRPYNDLVYKCGVVQK